MVALVTAGGMLLCQDLYVCGVQIRKASGGWGVEGGWGTEGPDTCVFCISGRGVGAGGLEQEELRHLVSLGGEWELKHQSRGSWEPGHLVLCSSGRCVGSGGLEQWGAGTPDT